MFTIVVVLSTPPLNALKHIVGHTKTTNTTHVYGHEIERRGGADIPDSGGRFLKANKIKWVLWKR